MKNGLSKNYFPGGNTPEGFYSFYEYLPYKTNKIYIIKGGPGTGKSTFMKQIAKKALKKGYNVELHWCSSDNNSIDGVVIPNKKISILDGTAPHTVDPIYPGAVEEILNFGVFWEREKLVKSAHDIINLTDHISELFKKCYSELEKTKNIYDLEKSYYKKIVLKNKKIKLQNKIINTIFKDNYQNNIYGKERHLFGTAITPEGHISLLKEISSYYKNRYIIYGKAGTGSMEILNNLGQKALSKGYEVLFLHSTLEPSSVNGVIIPKLNLSAVNASFPEKINSTDKDTIINLSEIMDKNILKKYQSELISLEKLMNKRLNTAITTLRKAKEAHDKLEEYYIRNMNFNSLNKLQKNITERIFN